MHNLEIEDFYHHDFTTASEWEVFIARLEEIIHEWKLPQTKIGPPLKSGDFINLSWEKQSEKLNFADVAFTLKHYKLQLNDDQMNEHVASDDSEDSNTQSQIDILNTSNDFAKIDEEHLEIARYYGVREFIVLTPTKQIAISDETRIKILVSSLTIALNNANCEVPALVQIQEPWQNSYSGIGVGRGTSSHLDMIHLKKIPPHCRHLTGLLALFKQKITEGCSIRLDPVNVSIKFTYLLKDWTSYTWTQDPPDFDFMQGETLGVVELGKLPFGATFDPVGELQLFTTWSQMSENIIVDSESFTDLEPQLATEWSAKVKMIPSTACLLGEYLTDFLDLCNNHKTMIDLLGEGATDIGNNDSTLSSALNILTESKIPTISRVMSRAASTKKNNKNVEGPIPEEVLLPVLYFLFPDADELVKSPYEDVSGYNMDDDAWRGVKTCAVNGLVWRFAIVAAHCAHNLGGAAALAQLWHEFVQELHFRWERGIVIPGTSCVPMRSSSTAICIT
ncbi:hypothetical protein PV325_008241 [Microctonus aethiopoides]|nr:hypothetical protein PV325_008241 [Microctonus aethiopoides]KAK0095571.1 hypothetical protein PV326_007940 [Microctonus aethiopoides]